MFHLMILELRKHNIRPFVLAVLIIAITMLGFLYLFAYAPLLEPDDEDMAIFSGYRNLIPLFGVLNMAVFCVLSAVMYTRFIIEDYTGKRVILLFSYPVSRHRLMLSKLCIVGLFTVSMMLISNIAVYLIFGISEQFMQLVNERFTFSIFLHAVETTFIMSLVAAGIGIAALGVGFIRRSMPTTIISAVLIASLMCNLVVSDAANKTLMYGIAIVTMSLGIACSILLMRKVTRLEAV